MKKIICLIDRLGFGGAERQMIGLAVLLKQKSYDVDLVTYDDHDFTSEDITSNHLNVIKMNTSDNKWSKLNAIRKLIKSRNYECMIAYKAGPNAIGCILKLMGIKFRLIVSERNTTQKIGRRERVLFQLYRMADYVVPNSQSQVDFIKKNCSWLKNKTLPITNFTDTNHFAAKYSTVGGTIKILTTARIAKQKNVLRYLDAIALLRDRGISNIHFDWYGGVQPGQEAYGEEVIQKLKALNLEGMISFHPATTEILQHYQACDVFCLPSNYEGFPNVICEAMSCGKPIACSRVCDNPYIVKEGENAFLFNQTSAEDIANKLQQICSMTQTELTNWGRRSREIAEELLSMDVFVNKYICLLEGKPF